MARAAERAIELTAGDAAVTVHPADGGRLGQLTIADTPLLVDVPPTDRRTALGWGAYPMAPWAGRVREGRFEFEGATHRLRPNHTDGDTHDDRRSHAIHGTVWDRPWEIAAVGERDLVLECDLHGALDWPFDGRVHHHIDLHPDRLELTLTVVTERSAFPAEVGWHPWFRAPDRLVFNPTWMYRRDAFGIPTGSLVPPTPGPWDDCFVNNEPVRLHYDRPQVHTVTVFSDCDHWVVFDELDGTTCVEPQSGPPDAFNLVHHVVTPDRPLRRSMTIAW